MIKTFSPLYTAQMRPLDRRIADLEAQMHAQEAVNAALEVQLSE